MRYKKTISFLALLLLYLCWLLLPLPTQDQAPLWIFYDRHGEVLFSETLTPPKPIPDSIKEAFVVIEDQAFAYHPGINPWALLKAGWNNLFTDQPTRGGSTITMQLARQKWLQGRRRNLWYKTQQIFYATKLEWKHSKEALLDQYLERAPLGNGTVGISQASERYFGKTPNQLDMSEVALLISILPNPSAYNPIQNPQKALQRRNHTLHLLHQRSHLSKEDLDFFTSQPIHLNPQINNKITAPHFVFYLKNRLQQHPPAPEKNTIHIHTTLDKTLYQDLLLIVQEEIKQREEKNNLHNVAAVVLDNPSGEIISMIGSSNFFDQEVDGAVNMAISPRQTGSILKPFLYATALEAGWSPADEIIDEPQGFTADQGRYNPRNFYFHDFYGRVRFREALTNSYNISAVYLLNQVTISRFLQTLKKLHLPLGEDPHYLGLSLILGSGETNLLNLTNAYRTLALHGQYTPPKSITSPQLPSANYHLPSSPPFSPSTTSWITHAMSDTKARWRLFGRGNVLEVDRPAAVKTGTSQGFRDNWTIGYSPRYTIGVWVGNADGSPLHTSSGIEGAAPIWNKIFRRLHHGTPEELFDLPGNRIETPLCRRPYKTFPDCQEIITEFLTPQEKERLTPTPKPPIRMSFPSHLDEFHANSQLLLKAVNTDSEDFQFYLNDHPTPPIIPSLPPGRHQIYVLEGEEKSEAIEILVMEK